VELYIGHAVSSYTTYQYLMAQPNDQRQPPRGCVPLNLATKPFSMRM
jgi:hypothetical protein